MKNFKIRYCKKHQKFNKNECLSEEFSIDYLYYKSNSNGQASGAYIMRTQGSSTFFMGSPVEIIISKGSIVTEIKVKLIEFMIISIEIRL